LTYSEFEIIEVVDAGQKFKGDDLDLADEEAIHPGDFDVAMTFPAKHPSDGDSRKRDDVAHASSNGKRHKPCMERKMAVSPACQVALMSRDFQGNRGSPCFSLLPRSRLLSQELNLMPKGTQGPNSAVTSTISEVLADTSPVPASVTDTSQWIGWPTMAARSRIQTGHRVKHPVQSWMSVASSVGLGQSSPSLHRTTEQALPSVTLSIREIKGFLVR
jgi:hypothetical protein